MDRLPEEITQMTLGQREELMLLNRNWHCTATMTIIYYHNSTKVSLLDCMRRNHRGYFTTCLQPVGVG